MCNLASFIFAQTISSRSYVSSRSHFLLRVPSVQEFNEMKQSLLKSPAPRIWCGLPRRIACSGYPIFLFHTRYPNEFLPGSSASAGISLLSVSAFTLLLDLPLCGERAEGKKEENGLKYPFCHVQCRGHFAEVLPLSFRIGSPTVCQPGSAGAHLFADLEKSKAN